GLLNHWLTCGGLPLPSLNVQDVVVIIHTKSHLNASSPGPASFRSCLIPIPDHGLEFGSRAYYLQILPLEHGTSPWSGSLLELTGDGVRPHGLLITFHNLC